LKQGSVAVPKEREHQGDAVASLTLYGLTRCDTCVKARRLLEQRGIDHQFVDYRDNPPSAATLREWAGQLGGWEKLVNRASTTWRTLPESRKTPGDDAAWTALIAEFPTLVRRPVAVSADGVASVGLPALERRIA
jgi:Spx/MgsR family transcriptional regulator